MQDEKTLEFIEKAKKIHGNKYDYSKVQYNKAKEKVIITCLKHGEFWQTPAKHLEGRGCRKCSIDKQKITLDDFLCKAHKIYGNKYDYSRVKLNGWDNKINILCKKHGFFEQRLGSFLCGKVGCKRCQKEKRENIEQEKNKDIFIAKFIAKFGDRFDFNNIKYINNRTAVKIKCIKHNYEFMQYPADINKGYYSCKCCNKERKIQKNTEKFLKKYSHLQDRIDFSKVKYVNNTTSIILICKKHNQEFTILPASIHEKIGCKECHKERPKKQLKEAIKKRAEKRRMPKEKYFNKVKKIHNNIYKYDETSYTTMQNTIIYFCKKHGKRTQQAQSHLRGTGCSLCGSEQRAISKKQTTEKAFWEEIKRKKIDKKFDLSNFQYINIHQKSIVKCKNHGTFLISPDNLKRGKGCPKCNQSKGEEKIREFLDNNKFFYDTELTAKKLFSNSLMVLRHERKRYDFVLDKQKIIIEFDGEQHFKAVDFQNKMAEEEKYIKFLKDIKTDEAKDELATTHGYKILRIPFWKLNNIDTILERLLIKKDDSVFKEYSFKQNRLQYEMVYELGIKTEEDYKKFLYEMENAENL